MLRLRFHGTSTIPVEAEAVTPDGLAGKSLSEIAKLPVQHGNRAEELGSFFAVEGDASDGVVEIDGDCSRVKLLGAGMKAGSLLVRGNAGMHLGAEMTGGEIRVEGSAGDWVGAEMKGGKIHVRGDAGHLVGAAYRGANVGMRGGVILVEGKAGNEIASGMRRGLIAVGGAGDYPGVSMIAGSVFIRGASGVRPGAGMKRGSIVYLGEPPAVLRTFRRTAVYEPVFLGVYLKQLAAWGFAVEPALMAASWVRYGGDLVSLGKGEIVARA